MITEEGELSSTRKGKGGEKRLWKGVKLEGLSPKEYYNIFLKGQILDITFYPNFFWEAE
jgi:hypothetical protein